MSTKEQDRLSSNYDPSGRWLAYRGLLDAQRGQLGGRPQLAGDSAT